MQIDNLMAIVGMSGGIIAFVISSFATIKYVDEKNNDLKHGIQDNLVDIKKRLARIEDLLMEGRE